jgi:hypothetical protein
VYRYASFYHPKQADDGAVFHAPDFQFGGRLDRFFSLFILGSVEVYQSGTSYSKERQAARGAVFFVSFLFFLGTAFGYFILAPLSINFLANYQLDPSILNEFDITSYIGTLDAGFGFCHYVPASGCDLFSFHVRFGYSGNAESIQKAFHCGDFNRFSINYSSGCHQSSFDCNADFGTCMKQGFKLQKT